MNPPATSAQGGGEPTRMPAGLRTTPMVPPARAPLPFTLSRTAVARQLAQQYHAAALALETCTAHLVYDRDDSGVPVATLVDGPDHRKIAENKLIGAALEFYSYNFGRLS